jgi:hypothetical protein
VDSAIQLLHPSEPSNQSDIPAVAPVPIAMTSPASNSMYQDLQLQPSTMMSVTSSNPLPVTASAVVDSLLVTQQQALVREENMPHLTVLNSVADRKYDTLPQYYQTAVRKKRKIEETIPSVAFHKSHAFDKRNFYDSSNILMNNALSNDDGYTAFDYNATTSWQTPSPTSSPSVW